ncbi:MAG: hypothetical protein PHS41_02970 [Victivallaceae bacterium]|nr:hypothetical protein [Victivallaceae bacterium]
MQRNQLPFAAFFSLLLLVLTLSGCGPTIKVDDKTYYCLAPSEEKQLRDIAQITMLNQKKGTLTREEYQHIRTTAPELEIKYTGHRFGKAFAKWTFPDKQIIVEMYGYLLTDTMEFNLHVRRNAYGRAAKESLTRENPKQIRRMPRP